MNTDNNQSRPSTANGDDETRLVIDFENRITNAVNEYLDGEEGYGDDTLLMINPANLEIMLVDDEEQGEAEARANGLPADAECFFCHVMDLVKMSIDNPGEWIADTDAIHGLAAEFC